MKEMISPAPQSYAQDSFFHRITNPITTSLSRFFGQTTETKRASLHTPQTRLEELPRFNNQNQQRLESAMIGLFPCHEQTPELIALAEKMSSLIAQASENINTSVDAEVSDLPDTPMTRDHAKNTPFEYKIIFALGAVAKNGISSIESMTYSSEEELRSAIQANVSILPNRHQHQLLLDLFRSLAPEQPNSVGHPTQA